MRTILTAGVLALALFACRAPDSFRALPVAEITAWQRCEPHMAVCDSFLDGETYGTGRARCFRKVKGAFAKGVTSRARGMWLIRHGCPPPIVAEFYD